MLRVHMVMVPYLSHVEPLFHNMVTIYGAPAMNMVMVQKLVVDKL